MYAVKERHRVGVQMERLNMKSIELTAILHYRNHCTNYCGSCVDFMFM